MHFDLVVLGLALLKREQRHPSQPPPFLQRLNDTSGREGSNFAGPDVALERGADSDRPVHADREHLPAAGESRMPRDVAHDRPDTLGQRLDVDLGLRVPPAMTLAH